MYITAKKYSIGLKYILITEFTFEFNAIVASWSEIYFHFFAKIYFILSSWKSICAFTFFIASLLKSKGMSYSTTSVVTVAGTPTIITGILTFSKLFKSLLSPNLKLLLRSFNLFFIHQMIRNVNSVGATFLCRLFWYILNQVRPCWRFQILMILLNLLKSQCLIVHIAINHYIFCAIWTGFSQWNFDP